MCALSSEQDVPQLVSLFSYYDKIYGHNSLCVCVWICFRCCLFSLSVVTPFTSLHAPHHVRGAPFAQMKMHRARMFRTRRPSARARGRSGRLAPEPTRIAGLKSNQIEKSNGIKAECKRPERGLGRPGGRAKWLPFFPSLKFNKAYTQ